MTYGMLIHPQIKGEDKPDYWRLISVVEVTHAVVWNAVYEGSEGAGAGLGNAFAG